MAGDTPNFSLNRVTSNIIVLLSFCSLSHSGSLGSSQLRQFLIIAIQTWSIPEYDSWILYANTHIVKVLSIYIDNTLTTIIFIGKISLPKYRRKGSGQAMTEINTINDEPLYNIGVVARMTGISMATLRAWERRYDFPDSERTAGGHRLYSEKDIIRLRWVKARIDEGMQTAQSISALRHQENTGHLVLTANLAAPIQPLVVEKVSIHKEEIQDQGRPYLDVFRDRLNDTLLNRDLDRADEVLGEALVVSTPDDLILKVIAPNIASFGGYWERGEINVATEHLATNYLRQRLLSWMLSGPPPRSTKPIVMACAPEEWHEGSLLVLGSLMRRRRWPVAYLGQSLPLRDLADFVRELAPNLVVLVAMTEKTAGYLADWPSWLPEVAQNNHPIIGYGGLIFKDQPEWRIKIPGIYLGNTFEEGVATMERLLLNQR